MTKNAKNDKIVRLQGLIAGLKLHQSGETLVLDGISITVAAFIAALESYIAMLTANVAAYDTWLVQTRTAKAMATTEIDPQVDALVRYLEATYGRSSSVLTDYGITPSKAAKRTVKAKATAEVKDEATRAARDTMGSREKEAIHGVVAPEPAPASPPASSPPAVAPTVTTPSKPTR